MKLDNYLYKNRQINLSGSSSFDVKNATAIRRWLIVTLLNNVFGGSSDNALQATRRVLQEELAGCSDFPLAALNDEIAKTGRSPYFDEFAAESFLGLEYGKRNTFLGLSLLYDDNAWGTMQYHQDHVFPQSLFMPKRMAEAGLSQAEQKQYLEMANSVANLQLLLATENVGKSDDSIDHWLTTRDVGFRKRHLLPDDNDLLTFARFPEFIAARQELIGERLKTLLTV